jgi:hypothetical protein
MEQKLNEVKKYLRDIKLSTILSDDNITYENDLDIFKNKLFYKKRKKFIDQLKNLDGILVGSAALSMYRINGVKIFNRMPNDLDFVVSRDNFIKFCGMNDFNNVKYTNTVVSLDFHTGTDRGTNSYGHHRGYLFHTDFDVIGSDDPISWNEVGDLKIESFLGIINKKLQMAEDNLHNYLYPQNGIRGFISRDRAYRDCAEKHIDDLYEIITKIVAYGS